MSTHWTTEAQAALTATQLPLAEAAAHIADQPGLYAMFAAPEAWQQLGLGVPRADEPLYVGKAEDSLATRLLHTHLRSGFTGQSTVRRTFAALLRDELGLRGLPRNQAAPERLGNFALSPEHDRALDAWMGAQLRLATWVAPAACPDLGEVERGLLAAWTPPLNLKDNPTRWQQRIGHARKRMSDDARAWVAANQLAVKPRR